VSTNLPPGPPPAGPPGPEYLESGGGRPLGSSSPAGGRRTAWLAGGVVGGLALVGAGAWAALSFFSTGPQPAEALPDSTIAYASIDLDPSGGQKIEALRTLRKFPAFKDQVGLDTDDDVRQRIFEEIRSEGDCGDLDYGDDIEPWLGDRMAVAAVDTGGDTPTPVFVVQVKDEDAADKGLGKLRDCGGGSTGAWSIGGGWAVVGESQDVVDGIATDAEDAPLADDDDYTRWTDEAGDAGIASIYVAPEAGKVLADQLGGLGDLVGRGGLLGMPADATTALEDFAGMAATVRFDDGALEVEVAADAGDSQEVLAGSDRGDDVLATLPEDTAVAFGVGLTDGWFGDVLDQLDSAGLADQITAETGLDLPEDVETLTGESAAFALGGDFDPETFLNSSDGTGVPAGLKVQGDPDAIEGVLDKLRAQLGPENSAVDSDTDGDLVAIGPDADYRAQLLEDGDLGGSEVFRNVVREADDAAAILFVNFDAGDWLEGVAGQDQEAADNLEPLEGLGMSSWLDDEASHVVLRVTTD
jgi:hypothetical protein